MLAEQPYAHQLPKKTGIHLMKRWNLYWLAVQGTLRDGIWECDKGRIKGGRFVKVEVPNKLSGDGRVPIWVLTPST